LLDGQQAAHHEVAATDRQRTKRTGRIFATRPQTMANAATSRQHIPRYTGSPEPHCRTHRGLPSAMPCPEQNWQFCIGLER
jgi:hypothetical protein